MKYHMVRWMGNWVEQRISFMDYMKYYQDNPYVKFIPHTANKGMISVLVDKNQVKSLVCTYLPIQSLF